jgi:hypothetical protein
MLKAEKLKGAIAIALLTVVGFACKSLGEPHTIKSKDGKYEMTVPANMTESPSLNKDAQLTAANRPHELYVFVLTNKKSDYAEGQTLNQHTDILRNALLRQLTDTDQPRPKASPSTVVRRSAIASAALRTASNWLTS